MAELLRELTVKINVDSEEVRPLVALCLEQTKLINDLNGAVLGRPDFYNRVTEMFDKINGMQLDDVLRKIQRDAFEAGFNANNDGVISYDHEDAVDAFNEWVKS